MSTSSYMDSYNWPDELDALLAAASPQSQAVANVPEYAEYPVEAFDGNPWGHPNSIQDPPHRYSLPSYPSYPPQSRYGGNSQITAAGAPDMYRQDYAPSPTFNNNANSFDLVGILDNAQAPVALDFSSSEENFYWSLYMETDSGTDLDPGIADYSYGENADNLGLPVGQRLMPEGGQTVYVPQSLSPPRAVPPPKGPSAPRPACVNPADLSIIPPPYASYESLPLSTPSSATFSNITTPTFNDYEPGVYVQTGQASSEVYLPGEAGFIQGNSASPTLSTGAISATPQFLPMKDVGQQYHTSPSQGSYDATPSFSNPSYGSPSPTAFNLSPLSPLSSLEGSQNAQQSPQGPNTLLLSPKSQYPSNAPRVVSTRTQKRVPQASSEPAKVDRVAKRAREDDAESQLPRKKTRADTGSSQPAQFHRVAKRAREDDDDYQPSTMKKSRAGTGSSQPARPKKSKPRSSVLSTESSARRATSVALCDPHLRATDYLAGGKLQKDVHSDGINSGPKGPEGVSFAQTPQTAVSSAPQAEYRCEKCNITIQLKSSFERHMETAAGHSSGVSCPVQGCEFHSKCCRPDSLRRHLNTLHKGWEDELDWETVNAMVRNAARGGSGEMEQKAHSVATR
ncbi:hypothetical protein EVG20_g8166 [Dentipellis fragilis]|uniref:C2H2-type domain-containing protein n=1 Tax=Dentipellis fragilis TaxID=205917 RepID=A0A4Y9Y9Z5_9AGAM|nr:hypothetical protein EVG20_g8166 [Dentipellis fragilis]